METQQRTCIRPKAKRGPTTLSPAHLYAIRGAVAATVARFGARLPPECAEDVIQDTFLKLWKSRAALDCLPYVRRAAINTAIDLLRRQSAQKRSLQRAETFDLVRALWQPPRTPEEIIMERQEAYQLLAKDPNLRKRVDRAMRQYVRATEHRIRQNRARGGALCPGPCAISG